MLAQRVPSGNLLHSLFDDEFDAVMAAAMEADPTAWKLEAAAPPVTSAKAPAQAAPVQATAANVPACVVAPSAAPRCVDATHASPCPWCTPAPTAEDESEYELVGDPGKKNGEKRLRSLLTHTPEWNSVDERYRLAVLCDQQGLTQLAGVLRTKGCSSLRKTHLLHLARTWGYASDLWCRRDERRQHLAKVDRAREAAAAANHQGAGSSGSGSTGAQVLPAGKATSGLAASGRTLPSAKAGGSVLGVKRQSSAPAGGASRPPKLAAFSKQPGGSKVGGYSHGGGGGMATARFGVATPQLMLPRMGAARSTAGGIAAWAVDVRSGPPDATPLGNTGLQQSGEEDASAPLAAVASHLEMVLRPLAAESARRFCGPSALADNSPAARAQLHSLVTSAAEWMHDIATFMESALVGLRTRAASLPAATAATVAWLELLGRACPLEDCMLRLQQGLHAATLGALPEGLSTCGSSQWPEDMVQGALMALELVARVQSLATQSKFTSYGTYVKVTVQLKALMADFTAQVARHLQARAARLAPSAAAAAPSLAPPPALEPIAGVDQEWPSPSVFDDLFLMMDAAPVALESPSSDSPKAVLSKDTVDTSASMSEFAALWQ